MLVRFRREKGYSKALLGFSVSSYKATKTEIEVQISYMQNIPWLIFIWCDFTIGETVEDSGLLQISPELLSLGLGGLRITTEEKKTKLNSSYQSRRGTITSTPDQVCNFPQPHGKVIESVEKLHCSLRIYCSQKTVLFISTHLFSLNHI